MSRIGQSTPPRIDKEILDSSGKPIEKPNDCETEKGEIRSITVDGQKINVVNTVTLMEIIVHKLEDGREVSQVMAQEFMMVDHKQYMIKQLTDAINVVMRAGSKKSGIIKAVSTVVAQKLGLMGRKK